MIEQNIAVEIVDKFNIIRQKGFIPQIRKGDTGAGHLFEHVWGVSENNSKAPDWKNIEIKTKGDQPKVTMFTMEPEWIDGLLNTNERCMTYGSLSKDGEYRFNSTLTWEPNNLNFKLDADSQFIYIKKFDKKIARFDLIKVQERINTKFKTLMVVNHDTNYHGIHFNDLTIYDNPHVNQFMQMIKNRQISVDFRMRTPNRNRGTAFRILHSKYFYDLYDETYNFNDLLLESRAD